MDFSRFEKEISDQKIKFEEIKGQKNAAKYDEICVSLNQTLANISLVASYIPVQEKPALISILHNMRDLAVELSDYKKSFNEVKEETVEEKSVEQPIEITADEGPSNAQSQTESQTLEKGNAKVLTLTNPDVPAGFNTQAA
jgi:hypothetical protein